MIGLLIFIFMLLLLLLLGGLPHWWYSQGRGYWPSTLVGMVLIIFLILILLERIPFNGSNLTATDNQTPQSVQKNVRQPGLN